MIRGTESRNEPMMQLNLSRFLDTDALRRPQLTVYTNIYERTWQNVLNLGDAYDEFQMDNLSLHHAFILVYAFQLMNPASILIYTMGTDNKTYIFNRLLFELGFCIKGFLKQ